MREDRLSEWNEHCSSRWHQGAGEAGRGEKRKAKAGWGPGPISPKRGSGEPLTAMSPVEPSVRPVFTVSSQATTRRPVLLRPRQAQSGLHLLLCPTDG